MTESTFNDYELFILKLQEIEEQEKYREKQKVASCRQQLQLQKHHIIPRHSGGPDTDENIVVCTAYNHALAHKIRFDVYGDYDDQASYLFISSQDNEARIALGKAIAYKNRKNNVGRFNRETQQKWGRMPKARYYFRDNPEESQRISKLSRGISKKTSEKAIQNYQERGKYVGTHFGREGGLKHQSAVTKQRLEGSLVCSHQSGIEVQTDGIKSLSEVQDLLNKKVPDSVRYTSGLSDIIRSREKRRYGWTVRDN